MRRHSAPRPPERYRACVAGHALTVRHVRGVAIVAYSIVVYSEARESRRYSGIQYNGIQ